MDPNLVPNFSLSARFDLHDWFRNWFPSLKSDDRPFAVLSTAPRSRLNLAHLCAIASESH